jgi:hypothetical protein
MPSVCPHVSRGRISVIFDVRDFYANLSRKFKFGCSRVRYRELYVEFRWSSVREKNNNTEEYHHPSE